MRAPRYDARCIDGVLPSVAAAMGVAGFRAALPLPPLRQAVVLVVDGLGQRQLLRAHEHAPLLAGAAEAHDPIDAAFPTTTPAGIATLALGMPPGCHGMVGATFAVPEFECVLNPLHWEDDPPAFAVQPEPNLFGRMRGVTVRSHGPARFATSGMTRTLLGGAEHCGYAAFDPDAIRRRDGVLDYVYLPELDKAGHTDGPNSDAWNDCIADIDRLIERMLQRIPPTAALIVTADHGMVSVPDERRIDADAPMLQAGVDRMAGEPRMRHLYTRQPDDVAARWMDILGDAAWVLTRAEALDHGLFGAVDEFLVDRIGDVLAIATADHAFTSRVVDPKPSGLRGLHGALTDEEILVPFLVLPGVA